MNIEKRKAEIMSAWDNFYYGIGENFADLIVSQEQSMMENLVNGLKKQFAEWIRYEEDKDELFKLFDLCMSENSYENKPMVAQLEANKAELLKMLKDIPCTCMDAYKDRGLTAPDCPRCNYVDLDLIEKMEEK